MRRQVPALGIVMIVLGAFNFLFYTVYLVLSILGVSMDFVEKMDYASDAEQIGQMVGGGLGLVWVGLWILGGLLWIIAGARIRGLRGRSFAMAMLILGAIPCCYAHLCCTWILNLGVAIWGMIVLLNADSSEAFLAVSTGELPEDVLGV